MACSTVTSCIPGHLSQVLPHSQQRHTQHVCPTHTHKARESPSVSSSTRLHSSPPAAQAQAATAPQAAPASGTVNTLWSFGRTARAVQRGGEQ